MSDASPSGVGGVITADIAVPQHERQVHFYARVLGTGESPLWREDLMNNVGAPIIGLGASSPEYAHLPLQWMPHIQVADVAGSVQRALSRGASELVHSKDEAHNSQWAVLMDPRGAAFGVIPAVSAVGHPQADRARAREGRISRLDLTVDDAKTRGEFYCDVIGWSLQEVEMADDDGRYTDYEMVSNDGTPAGRVRHARGTNLGLPPVWLICLPVGDLNESLRRVRSLGGKVIKAIQQSDGQYAHAVIEDLVGAHVALMPGPGPVAR